MFRRKDEDQTGRVETPDRVDSVLGPDLAWSGRLTGQGGVRIDGAFDGAIEVEGLVVVGDQGRVSCDELRAATVIVAGAVRGDIIAERVEIMPTGRVWGDVVTTSFSTEEGAFMRGQIRMEEQLDLDFAGGPAEEPDAEAEGVEEESADEEVEQEDS